MTHHIYFGRTSSENWPLSDAALHRASLTLECSQCPHLESAVCVSAGRSETVAQLLGNGHHEVPFSFGKICRAGAIHRAIWLGNRRVGWRNADQDSRTQLLIFHGETG